MMLCFPFYYRELGGGGGGCGVARIDSNVYMKISGHGTRLCFGDEIAPQGIWMLLGLGPFEEGYGLHNVGFLPNFLQASGGSSDREVGFIFGHLEPKGRHGGGELMHLDNTHAQLNNMQLVQLFVHTRASSLRKWNLS